MYTLVPVRVYVCGYVYVCVRTVDTSVHACASMYVSRSLCKHTYRSPWRDRGGNVFLLNKNKGYSIQSPKAKPTFKG